MLRILVVEDVPNMQARVVDFLTQRLSGYEVTTASNRAEALQRIAEEAPNLVLLDLVIPPDGTTTSGAWTEGRAVLRCVKEQCPHVKVIALTGQGELARDFLLEEGADDFFTKDSREEWAQEKMALQLDALLGYLVCRSPAMLVSGRS
jgi:CheY-like chemotaxis protein